MEKDIKKDDKDKTEFNFDTDLDKSKVLKEYPAKARFQIDKGRYVSYTLKCISKIDENKVNHTRDEQLSEKRQQFLVRYLCSNLKEGKNTYDGVFQVRQNNETGKTFYCWIIIFAENYKLPLLVLKDERQFLEGFYFKKGGN